MLLVLTVSILFLLYFFKYIQLIILFITSYSEMCRELNITIQEADSQSSSKERIIKEQQKKKKGKKDS